MTAEQVFNDLARALNDAQDLQADEADRLVEMTVAAIRYAYHGEGDEPTDGMSGLLWSLRDAEVFARFVEACYADDHDATTRISAEENR